MRRLGILLAMALASPSTATGLELPSVDHFADQHRSAPDDAAVVVGVEQYAFVDHVPYAGADAQAFWEFLVQDRGVPANRISLLKDSAGVNNRIQREVERRAADVGPHGTLWFFFAGHGAPAPDGTDGLLVGADAQQSLEGLADRSVPRNWLMRALGASHAQHVVVLLDACFSGKSRSGTLLGAGLRPLLPTAALEKSVRGVLVTGAKADQVSGALDAAHHGLFSYFLLGALRGWGLPQGRGTVTLDGAFAYVSKAMSFVLANADRSQEPELYRAEEAADLALAEGLGETGPDLTDLARTGGAVVATPATASSALVTMRATPAKIGAPVPASSSPPAPTTGVPVTATVVAPPPGSAPEPAPAPSPACSAWHAAHPIPDDLKVRLMVDRQVVPSRSFAFATGTGRLLPSNDALLDAVYAAMLCLPLPHLEVRAHTDSGGDEAANLALSRLRAEAVRAELIRRGADPGRVTAQGFGSSRPLASNQTAQGRATNRRVEIWGL